MDAHKIELPAKLQNHYVVAVTGIPAPTLMSVLSGRGGGRGGSGGRGGFGGGGRGRDGSPNRSQATDGGGQDSGPPPPPPDPAAILERAATLVVKGKTPQNADVVLSMYNNATLLFGFVKTTLDLNVTDKEVDFELKLGGLAGKAKFSLKDMMYNGELAL